MTGPRGGVKVLEISAQLLADILDLPPNVEIVGIEHERVRSDVLGVVVRSAAFEGQPWVGLRSLDATYQWQPPPARPYRLVKWDGQDMPAVESHAFKWPERQVDLGEVSHGCGLGAVTITDISCGVCGGFRSADCHRIWEAEHPE